MVLLFLIYVYSTNESVVNGPGKVNTELKLKYKNLYGSYIKAYFGVCSVVFLALCCQAYGENQNKPGSNRNFHGVLFNLGRLGNTARTILPIVTFIIRVQDPKLKFILFKIDPHSLDSLSLESVGLPEV